MFKRFKWLSLKNILESLRELALRFPLVTIDTAVATLCGYILTDSHNLHISTNTEHILEKILLMAVLGLPLLTATTLISEKFKLKTLHHWILQVVGVGLLVIYYCVLPQNPDDFSMVHATRLFIFNIVTYLFALSFPFYEKGQSVKFWRFVEVAFARLVVSAFFSLTLFAGIALSLAAIDYLFQANIQGETYLKSFIIIVGIFGAWFFLGGFPKLHEGLPERAENSKVLRIFLQYICVPLLCIFFVILYVYLGKIVVLWNWPKGGVADWVLGFSSAGFLVYVLSFPLAQKDEHSWFSKFFRVFFALVIPMVVVLFMAIGIRLKEYGVTESRYLVGLGGVWLLISSVYYLFSKQKELKLLPYLAAAFLFLSSVGPWSMYSVSVRSQYSRLEGLLNKNHLLQNGVAVKVADENSIPQSERASIYSKIQFILEHEKTGKIYDWFKNVNTETYSRNNPYSFSTGAMESLGITRYYDVVSPPTQENLDNFYLDVSANSVFPVHGFDVLIRQVGIYPKQVDVIPQKYQVASTTYMFTLENNTVKVFENDKETFSFDLTSNIDQWKVLYGSSPMYQQQKAIGQSGEMTVEQKNAKEKIQLLFDNISLHKVDGAWKIESGSMNVLIQYE